MQVEYSIWLIACTCFLSIYQAMIDDMFWDMEVNNERDTFEIVTDNFGKL
jgi:hypothetical protein